MGGAHRWETDARALARMPAAQSSEKGTTGPTSPAAASAVSAALSRHSTALHVTDRNSGLMLKEANSLHSSF